MYEETLLPTELLDFSYYQNKCPLYLQNSSGFLSHFKNWFDLLVGESSSTGIINAGNDMLYGLNIFDQGYLQKLSQLPGYDQYNLDILDKLAELFGVSRVFDVSYIYNNTTINRTLQLTNEELLLLIKSRVIRNYCDGTREQIEQYYKDAGLRIYSYKSDDTASAMCKLILALPSSNNSYYTQNIVDMFLSGMLHIPSMGISYEFSTQLISQLIWSEGNWDEGEWQE